MLVGQGLSLFPVILVVEVGVLIARHVLEGIELVITVVGGIGGVFGIQQLVLVAVEVTVGLRAASQAAHLPEVLWSVFLSELLI
jgi:hypothetical protein